MKTLRVVLVPFLSSAILAAVSGCGSAPFESEPFESEPFGPQPLNAAESERAGKVLGNAVEDAALEYGPVGGQAAMAPCITLAGDVTDADGDKIPADALLTFDCNETRLGFTGTVTGTAHVVDGQPNQLAWDFTSIVDLDSSLTGPFGGSIARTRDGQIVASQESPLGPFHLDRSLEIVTLFHRPNGQERTLNENADWTMTFTPEVSWQAGSPAVQGELAVAGAWYVSTGSHEAETTLETKVPLTLAPTCQTGVTSGAITASFEVDEVQRSVTVTWTACGERVVSYSEE